jgi:hypothetical protein
LGLNDEIDNKQNFYKKAKKKKNMEWSWSTNKEGQAIIF